jgi:hypothetical protein
MPRSPLRGSADGAGPAGEEAIYTETVHLLRDVSARHHDALQALLRIGAGQEGGTDRLAAEVRSLEDLALGALSRLARASDYEAISPAMQDSHSSGWLWGMLLNRALETVAVLERHRFRG